MPSGLKTRHETPCGDWQRTLYRAAKAAPQRTVGMVYDTVSRREGFAEAWRRVRRKRGRAGVDTQTIADVEAYGVDRFLAELATARRETRYHPLPGRRVYMPTPGKPGQRRGVGIPAGRDRMVQTAVKLGVEPIFEADFRDCAYGVRPKRGAHDAISEGHAPITWGYRNVIDADLKAGFAS